MLILTPKHFSISSILNERSELEAKKQHNKKREIRSFRSLSSTVCVTHTLCTVGPFFTTRRLQMFQCIASSIQLHYFSKKELKAVLFDGAIRLAHVLLLYLEFIKLSKGHACYIISRMMICTRMLLAVLNSRS